MKVGILTYHSIYNFGANLQAYSTVGYLKNNGFDPIIIHWVAKDLEDGYDRGNPLEQANAHKNFVENKLPITRLCRTTEDVASVINENKIEAVLIGSDAVLQHKTRLSRMRITKRGIKFKEKRTNVIFPNPFWGSFIPLLENKIPVMVLSASSQNMSYAFIKGELKKQIGEALNAFSKVTVRDDWTRKMVMYFTKGKVNPSITPDPVFGFNQNIQEQPTKEEILKKFNLPGNYVLLSFKHHGVVSDEWLDNCNRELQKNNSTGILLTMPGGIIFKKSTLRQIPPPLDPQDWYSLIKYSAGYIGENMHPIVVSLHNNVPFFSFDSYGIVQFRYFVNEKSSKIYHILKKAGLSQHRICSTGKKYTSPAPEHIVDILKNFDVEKCRKFSNSQIKEYNQMMLELLKF